MYMEGLEVGKEMQKCCDYIRTSKGKKKEIRMTDLGQDV